MVQFCAAGNILMVGIISTSWNFKIHTYVWTIVVYSIWWAACFWHDMKNNSDKRNTQLKCLLGYSNWEYCCVSAVA